MRLSNVRTLSLIAACVGAFAFALPAQEAGPTSYALARQANYLPLETVREGHVRMPAALARRVTVKRDRVSLQQALLDIATQAGLGLSYGEEVVRGNTIVSVDVRRRTAADALAAAVHGTEWTVFVTAAGQVTVVRTEPPQVGTVAGRVTDAASGRPLASVQLRLEGSRFSVSTDDAGQYRIVQVPAGSYTLTARRIGYSPATRPVTVASEQISTVDIVLEAQAVSLGEVVVVGYGTQQRRDITGSIAKVDLTQLDLPPVITSADRLLQGRAAGVQVVQATGAPGGAVSVRIRGGTSISASSEPLYVIDGVPAFVGSSASGNARSGLPLNPLSDLNPNDIESLEILKDASATAIYGARGANGVVLITTKRGRAGESRTNLESTYGMQAVARTLPMLNARQFAELVNESNVNAGRTPVYTPEEVAQFGSGTDWQREIFREAPVWSQSVTFAGGEQRTRYLLTGSIFDQQGILVGSQFRRYSARLNLDREVSSRFRIGSNLSLNRTISDIGITDSDQGQNAGTVEGALEFAPTEPVRDAEGNYVLFAPIAFTPNPVATALEIVNERTASRALGNIFGEFDILPALQLRVSLGGNTVFARSSYFAPSSSAQGSRTGGTADVSSNQGTDFLNENILSWRGAPERWGTLGATAGFTVETSRSEGLSAATQSFATDVTGPDDLGAGALPLPPGSGVTESAILSYLGRVNYSLRDRYLFTLSARSDGSSKFGRNDKWGFFPSAAFAWRLSAEPFLSGQPWLSDLKLRTSLGVTGNQEIGTYASLARLATSQYAFGDGAIGYAPAGLAPNPDLRWESNRQANVGLDVGLYNDRVTIVTDVYRSTTRDLLVTVPLPSTSGYNAQIQNVGSVRNWGAELAIGAVLLDRGRLDWRTDLNLATGGNEVVSLGEAERIFPTGSRVGGTVEGGLTAIIQVGAPLGSFYTYRTAGIWQTADSAAIAASGDPFAAPGEWRFVDVNGDGKISTDDRTITGSAVPKLFGGLSNHVSYGPLDLRLFLQGSWGNEVYNLSAIRIRAVRGFTNEMTSSLERWTPERPSNTQPRANADRTSRALDRDVEDGSYLRLQNITIGYRVPERLVPGVRSARVYLSGDNVHVWNRYSGYDPEVNSYGGHPALRGFDLGTYPRARTITAGINLGL